MLYKNKKTENPFIVHSVNRQGPLAYSHGSNEFRYTKPKLTEKKPIEISKPKIYRAELSSDELNPFVNRIIHGIPAIPPKSQIKSKVSFPLPKDIGDPYLLKNRLPGEKFPISHTPIIHPIHGIPALPPWKEPKQTFPIEHFPIEKHPFIPPITIYHSPVERPFPTYPMPKQTQPIETQPKQTQPTQVEPQPEDMGTPKGALLGVLALLLPFIF
jgi:hypothetical protein